MPQLLSADYYQQRIAELFDYDDITQRRPGQIRWRADKPSPSRACGCGAG